MANIQIRSSEYAWQHANVKILDRTLLGITGWSLKKELDKEAIYAAGQEAIDIQEGVLKCSGSITILGFELDALDRAAQLAGYEDILRVPHELIIITVSMRKTLADPITTIVARGVSFTESEEALSQGDKTRKCQLPFICLSIKKTTVKL